jgi:geranylgeranyl diphosphate synthase type II
MERLKTAAYSFEAPLKAGALLAGAERHPAEALAAVGRRIGLAYQIVDDVLGTFGEPGTTGKSAESDLREGKRTVLTAYAAEAEGFDDLLAAFRRGEAGVGEVRAALRDCGADAQAMRLARILVDEALEESRLLPLDAGAFSELAWVCNHVLTRGS